MATRVWIVAVRVLVAQTEMVHTYLDLVRCTADLSGFCDMNVLGRCSRLDTDRSVQLVAKKDGSGHPRPDPSFQVFLL